VVEQEIEVVLETEIMVVLVAEQVLMVQRELEVQEIHLL
jgi:hypothetical protein